MSFAFVIDESLADAFHRLLAEQLTRAGAAVTDADLTYADRIHDIRKRFKESRAVLRLFRAALGASFDERNRWYREMGRLLAPYRDATATLGALKSLPVAMRREIGRGPMAKLRRAARRRIEALYGDRAAIDQALRQIDCDAELERTADLRLVDVNAAVRDGFARTLSAARKAMGKAFATGEETLFHEWRKRVKDHWVHVKLFVPVWPKLIGVREELLDELSHLLGDHHDVAVVRAFVGANRFRNKDEVRRIGAILSAYQRAIAEKARPAAEKLFAPRPRDEARETLALWRAWHITR